jgi:Trk K+ transport system NAD-binding subunit
MPIVRQVRLDRTVSHVLTSEAMLVDAVGAILAIVMLQVALTPGLQSIFIIQDVFVKFAVGAAVGLAGGWLLSWALSGSLIKDLELRTIATLASAWGLFLLADAMSSQAGLLAVLMAGATLQRMELPDIQRLRHFKGSLSMLLISVLFVLLAANLDLSILTKHFWAGLAVFIILTLVARPLVVLFSSIGTKLSSGQAGFLAAMAPRGVVAAAITSLFALILKENGLPQSDILLSLVYAIIIMSVFVYGMLAAPLSRMFAVEGGDDRSTLIIGGGQIGAELGRVLGEDREVRFLDLNAEVVNNLQRSGYAAVRGNALDPLYMEVIHAEEVGVVIVMTGSSDHNLLIARLAREDFHVPEVYVALQEGDEDKHARLIHQLQARRLFAKAYNFTYWNDQAYRKRLVYEMRHVEEDSGLIGHRMADVRIPHGVQPLAIIRDGQTCIPYDDFLFAAGDDIKIIMRPDRIQEGQPLILPPATDSSMVSIRQTA